MTVFCLGNTERSAFLLLLLLDAFSCASSMHAIQGFGRLCWLACSQQDGFNSTWPVPVHRQSHRKVHDLVVVVAVLCAN